MVNRGIVTGSGFARNFCGVKTACMVCQSSLCLSVAIKIFAKSAGEIFPMRTSIVGVTDCSSRKVLDASSISAVNRMRLFFLATWMTISSEIDGAVSAIQSMSQSSARKAFTSWKAMFSSAKMRITG